jgi:hypothetical protein
LASTLGKDGIGTDIRRYGPMSRERIRGERAGKLECAVAIYNVIFILYTSEPISEGLGEQPVLAPLIQPKAFATTWQGPLMTHAIVRHSTSWPATRCEHCRNLLLR